MDIQIVDFSSEHVDAAQKLAMECYFEELNETPKLPHNVEIPPLDRFVDFGLGCAAISGGELIGFLCFYPPLDNIYATRARGTFSPIHGHGAVAENRQLIYKLLYQAAAQKLADKKISCHSVALYAHDKQCEKAFFDYGFGLRCIDAIRAAEKINETTSVACDIRKTAQGNAAEIRSLRVALSEHLCSSPCFMYMPPETVEKWLSRAEKRSSDIYAAFVGSQPIAFLEIDDEGENFATEAPEMRSICGAFCLPQYRGQGVMQSILNRAVDDYRIDGIKLIGVDYESFNATAYGFWQKYFTDYTHTVVRRIDELALEKE